LIIIAFLISAPLAYYNMQSWLNKFEFSTDLSLGIFLMSGIAAFLIAVFTISFKSFQAASTNPVDTLSEE